MLAVADGLLVGIWNVSIWVARLSANLEPILEFGIVPKVAIQVTVGNDFCTSRTLH